jgi:5-methylcytosine-specific restriction enzyme subunit McrC
VEQNQGQDIIQADSSKKIIELKEYEPTRFQRDDIPDEIAHTLWSNYRKQIDIVVPSFQTDNQWILTSKGCVGHIPVAQDFIVVLSPKVPLGNLFGMLEYAYNLKSFQFLDGLVDCDSIQEFYEKFANVLSKKVLDRNRKGFYRCYEGQREILPYVRGKIDMGRVLRKPWVADIRCHYEDLTADVDENQILTWTLFKIARSGICTERVLPTVRRAYRSLQGLTSLISHPPESCIKRFYNRLNNDYEPMHALCRFFLEHSGPTHQVGEKRILPFLVNMARLFERFVAEWLRQNLPDGYSLKYQEKVNIGRENSISFDIDMVIYDSRTGKVSHVIDTKYKAPTQPSTADIAQIVAYSESKNCKEAILLYPINLTNTLDEWIGDNRVRNLKFILNGDLESAGNAFLSELLSVGRGDNNPRISR